MVKVLIGIRRTSQMAGIYEDSPLIRGQQTDIITTGTEEEVRSFVKKFKNLEKELPKLTDQLDRFLENFYSTVSEETLAELERKIIEAKTLKKYDTVLMIDGEII